MTQPYIYMNPFSPRFPSHLGYHITLSRLPCAKQYVLVGYVFKFFKIHLFLAALGVCCCRGYTLVGASHLWQSTGSRVRRLQQLWLIGLAALQRAESSLTRDQTHVPCIGRQILNHWTTREVLVIHFKYNNVYMSNPNSLNHPFPPQATMISNCVYERLCFISVYSVPPLARCVARGSLL